MRFASVAYMSGILGLAGPEVKRTVCRRRARRTLSRNRHSDLGILTWCLPVVSWCLCGKTPPPVPCARAYLVTTTLRA
jgi:hypothetical protein